MIAAGLTVITVWLGVAIVFRKHVTVVDERREQRATDRAIRMEADAALAEIEAMLRG